MVEEVKGLGGKSDSLRRTGGTHGRRKNPRARVLLSDQHWSCDMSVHTHTHHAHT